MGDAVVARLNYLSLGGYNAFLALSHIHQPLSKRNVISLVLEVNKAPVVCL